MSNFRKLCSAALVGLYLGMLPSGAAGSEKSAGERAKFLRKFTRTFWKGFPGYGSLSSFFTNDFRGFVRNAAEAAAFGKPKLNPNSDLLLVHFAYGIRIRYACPRSLTRSQAKSHAYRIANLPVKQILKQLGDEPFSFLQFSKPELDFVVTKPGTENGKPEYVRFRAYDILTNKTLFTAGVRMMAVGGERKLSFTEFRSFFNTSWPAYRRFLVKRREISYPKNSVEKGAMDNVILLNSVTEGIVFGARNLDQFSVFKKCRYYLPPSGAQKMSDMTKVMYALNGVARRMIVPIVDWR